MTRKFEVFYVMKDKKVVGSFWDKTDADIWAKKLNANIKTIKGTIYD